MEFCKKVLTMKTQIVNDSNVDRNWLLIDAEGQALGRISTKIAEYLRGKHKVSFSPSVDVGDFVIVVNAEKVTLSGNKAETKEYFSHSTHPGGGKFMSYAHALEKDGTIPVAHAVKGMLPKNSLGRRMFKKLHVYTGSEHPHEAQKPEVVSL